MKAKLDPKNNRLDKTWKMTVTDDDGVEIDVWVDHDDVPSENAEAMAHRLVDLINRGRIP